MGSEKEVTTATLAPQAKRSVPGFYFSELTAEPTYRYTETAVPVFLYDVVEEDTHVPQSISSFAKFLSISKEIKDVAFKSAVRGYFENGGSGGYIAPLKTGNAGEVKANVEKIINALPDSTLICYPHAIRSSQEKPHWHVVWSAILSVCKASGRCFALIDLPASAQVAKNLLENLKDIKDGSLGYGAAYWPPVEVEGGSYVLPCGMIAAAIQKTDRARGIWKAPANVTLANVYNTEVNVSETENTALFEGDDSLGINAIRVFPGRGVKVWGCRTLMAKQDENRSFVQSSRMLSYIENNLQRLSRFAVFEPSNEITWVKLHNIIYAWLHALWLKGGLAGATEKEAFRVLVGKNESMTEADINKGVLKADIAFALQQRLQFIHLQIHMIGSELSVTNRRNEGGDSK